MLKLSDLLSQLNPEKVLFVHREGAITGADFFVDVAQRYQQISESTAQRFALCYLDSYGFTVALFAVLAAKRHVILLPNNQPGTLAEFVAEYDEILTEDSQGSSQRRTLPRDLDGAQEIVFFTSGSTGKATRVVRSLAQFMVEMKILEKEFGQRLANKAIYSTVSHQHLYGFSFFILWPLCAGRSIHLPMLTQAEAILAVLRTQQDVCLISSPAILQRLGASIEHKSVMIFSSCSLLKAEDAKALGHYPIEILGSTETSVVAFRQQTKGNQDWTPLPTIKVSRDSDSGCLKVTSRLCHHSDGFLMGDTVKFTEKNRFQLLGRADRIAKVEGKRVSLSEIERRLNGNALVEQAYAILLENNRQYTAVVIGLSSVGYQGLVKEGKRWLNQQLTTSLRPFFDSIVLPKQFRYCNQIPRNSQSKLVQADIEKLFSPSGLKDPLRLATRKITEDHIEFDLYMQRELVYFSGHFPEQPILPGIAQINWAIQFACDTFCLDKQNFLNIGQLKFTHVILPESRVTLSLSRNGHKIEFYYALAGTTYSLGQFQIGRLS